MNTSKLHRTVGLIFCPFFLLTAVTGIALLWRKSGVYGSKTKSLLIKLHNWEIAAKYIGVILAVGIIFMVITGLIMIIKLKMRKPVV